MSLRTAYLIPDTNLFIQCQALHTLDWKWLGELDEIILIVTRPVQNEIDDQKQRRKGRVSDRARDAHGELRRLITEQSEKIVRPAAPVVRLTLDLMIKPTPGIEVLDYDQPDDRLVACAHAYAALHPGADVRILSHDGGPLASAKAIGMAIAPIPDDWLLEPETSDAERKLLVSEAEVARLRKAEPVVGIECLDASDKAIKDFTISHETFAPLTDAEIRTLRDLLQEACPERTDFGPDKPETRPTAGVLASAGFSHETWEPAKPDEIEQYHRVHYPAWLSRCEYSLRHLHHALEGRRQIPVLRFEATNAGSRPANDVMVEFRAQGAILIRPSEDDSDDTDSSDVPEADNLGLTLPAPPNPPHGTWVKVRAPSANTLSGLSSLDHLARLADPFAGFRRANEAFIRPSPLPDISHLVPPRVSPRDSNAFYYKGGRRPYEPRSSYQLECDQWRHSTPAEFFDVELHIDAEATSPRGLLAMTIHADNLSNPVVKRIPIKVDAKAGDVFSTARHLVVSLKSPVQGLDFPGA